MTPFLFAFLLPPFLFGNSPASQTPLEEVAISISTDFLVHVTLDASADTVKSGQTFITNLPDSVSGQPVVRYRGIVLPARSWLMKRSFFWRTSATDQGNHEFWFRAYLKDETIDSLSVQVVVE
ncbi:MAG: hypothetical protein BMS9Abin05_2012 [Rhodothermia bacterium]|nr:MAG: hypothetical protein BMS9Abin05_2012 [Rhodothermia bacterium]